MKRQNNIDKLFNAGLQGSRMEPPGHLWESIATAVAPTPSPAGEGKGKSRRRLLWWAGSGVVMLCFITGWILYSNRMVHEHPSLVVPTDQTAAFITEKPDVTATTPHSATTTLSPPAKPRASRPQPFTQPTSTTSGVPSPNPAPVTLETTPISVVEKAGPPEATIAESAPESLETMEYPITEVPEEPLTLTPLPVASTDAEPTVLRTAPDSSAGNTTVDIKAKRPFSRALQTLAYGHMSSMALSAGSQLYKPFTPGDSRGLGAGYQGELLYHHRWRNLRLTTGLGLSGFTETNPWNVSVLQIDTIGYYEYVKSLQFQPVYNPIDSTITGYVPVNIITSTYPIVDSTVSEVPIEAKNRYIFVQVPLLVGYDILHSGNLTLGVSAGMVWNRRVATRKPLPEYPGEGIVLDINDLGYQRRETWWECQAGLYTLYNLSAKWYLEGMSAFRIPLRGWYDLQGADGKPRILLIQAGIGYLF